MEFLHQGDIVKIEKIKHPVLIVSKDFFNTSNAVIGCPIIKDSYSGPLHIWVETDETEGYVHCENVKFLDLAVRGYKKIDRLSIAQLMNVADAIQGIFEYI